MKSSLAVHAYGVGAAAAFFAAFLTAFLTAFFAAFFGAAFFAAFFGAAFFTAFFAAFFLATSQSSFQRDIRDRFRRWHTGLAIRHQRVTFDESLPTYQPWQVA